MIFEALIKRIAPKLKGIVYKIPKYVNSLDGDDLYEEAVMRLWTDYQAGKLAGKTDSYVLQSCYFYLKNYVRKFQDKLSVVSMNVLLNEEGSELQDILSAEEGASVPDKKDMDTLMSEVFEKDLSRKEKEIAFFYLQGWTTREIGKRLGLSHVSVMKLEDKIRKKCRESKFRSRSPEE